MKKENIKLPSRRNISGVIESSMIICDYCGTAIDITKDRLCPGCSAPYNSNMQWLAMRNINLGKTEEDKAENSDVSENETNPKTDASVKKRRIVLIASSFILVLAVVYVARLFSWINGGSGLNGQNTSGIDTDNVDRLWYEYFSKLDGSEILLKPDSPEKPAAGEQTGSGLTEPHNDIRETSGKIKAKNIKGADIGDTVLFGKYEQDNEKTNGWEDIEWLVLDKKDNMLLLLSDKALDSRQYNTTSTNVTWESSSLREWLNGAFLSDAFTSQEQKRILTTDVSADKNPMQTTNPGNDTKDIIFLLSIDEAERYFSSDEARKCVPTDYAKAHGAFTNGNHAGVNGLFTKAGTATCWWWLRSPGENQNSAARTDLGGIVDSEGHYVSKDGGCVRPALWIKVDS